MGIRKRYIEVMDALFNGGENCQLQKERPQNDYLMIIEEQQIPVSLHSKGGRTVKVFYRGIEIASCYGYVTVEVIEDAVCTLRGLGRFEYVDQDGVHRRPVPEETEIVLKRAGIWIGSERHSA